MFLYIFDCNVLIAEVSKMFNFIILTLNFYLLSSRIIFCVYILLYFSPIVVLFLLPFSLSSVFCASAYRFFLLVSFHPSVPFVSVLTLFCFFFVCPSLHMSFFVSVFIYLPFFLCIYFFLFYPYVFYPSIFISLYSSFLLSICFYAFFLFFSFFIFLLFYPFVLFIFFITVFV